MFENMQDFNTSFAKIKIFGVGGGGCNAVNRLKALNVEDVLFIAANTDMIALNGCAADIRIQLGKELTKGLGAGSNPEIGEKAAKESEKQIEEAIKDANLLFITAGMGGGTGTGAVGVVAEIARKYDILTIAVVTKPFEYEGERKMRLAEYAIGQLQEIVDVLVVVPNELAFKHVDKEKPMFKVVQAADDILRDCILGVSSIVVNPSLINLDFADIRTAISGMKTAHIGVGKGEGKDKVMDAFKRAVSSDMLNTTIEGATHVIINMTGDMNVTASEVGLALDAVKSVVDPNAMIKHGLGFRSDLNDQFFVTIVATGFEDKSAAKPATEFNTGYPSQFAEEDYAAPAYSAHSLVAEKQEEELSPRLKIDDKDLPPFIARLRNKSGR